MCKGICAITLVVLLAAGVQAGPSPLVDISATLRKIESLQHANQSKDAYTIKSLQDLVRSVNPDFITNEVTPSTSTDIEKVSTTYRNLGCDLAAAIRHRNSTTYLTFKKLEDGLGNFVVQLIKAMAFTYHRGWNFLGVQGNLKVSFGNHEDDILNFYFGNHTPLLTSRSSFPNNTNVISLGLKRHQHSAIINKRNTDKRVIYDIHTTRFELEHYINKHHKPTDQEDLYAFIKNRTNQYISPPFLAHLRSNALCGVNKALSMVKREKIDQEPPGAIKVVAHIRMGDVMLNTDFTYKRIPLQYYPKIFLLIRKLCPLCKLYAFTSVQHDNQLKSIQPYTSALEKMGVTVYVDKEFSQNSTNEALNTIAHFSTADVFLTAKSEFSVVSAYLNPNCVIYSTYAANAALYDWTVIPYVEWREMLNADKIEEMLSVIETSLPHCLEQKLAHKRVS